MLLIPAALLACLFSATTWYYRSNLDEDRGAADASSSAGRSRGPGTRTVAAGQSAQPPQLLPPTVSSVGFPNVPGFFLLAGGRDEDNSELARVERMRGQASAFLPSGIRADFRAMRTRVPQGAPFGVQLKLIGTDGEPLREPSAGVGLVVSIPGRPPSEAVITPDPNVPGSFNSFVEPKLQQRGEVSAVATVRDSPPGQPLGQPVSVAVSVDYGVEAMLDGRPLGRYLPEGLGVEVLVRAYRPCHVAVRAALKNKSDQVLGETVVEGDAPGGPLSLVLQYGPVAAPGAADLQLDGTTLFVRSPSGQMEWADFWSDPRDLTIVPP